MSVLQFLSFFYAFIVANGLSLVSAALRESQPGSADLTRVCELLCEEMHEW
jgi:hypothetical protein